MSVVVSVRAAVPEPALDRGWRPGRWRCGLPLAVVVAVARLLLLRLRLTSDEGGYLLAASQWHHGASTYGGYFVDRPPLLMAIYALADAAGGAVPLRLIGVAAAVVAVLVAGRIGGRPGAAVAAIFVTTPLFGTTNVDGELLALPFVLAGVLALLRAFDPAGSHHGRWATSAGMLAMAAFLVKQDMVDVFVAAAAAGMVLAAGRRRRQAGDLLVRCGLGALGTGTAALALAWVRGTTPLGLWQALVVFRVQAGRIISADGSAAGGTTERLHAMLEALLVSGAPAVALVALAVSLLERPADARARTGLRWVALSVLGWECAGILLGGSYWRHYLIALIPGLVLLIGTVPHPWRGRWLPRLMGGSLLLAAVSSVLAYSAALTHPPASSSAARVSTYLASHRALGQSVVVAFGSPNIVYDAGMSSPYEHLWSLSARVRDPRLTELTRVMRGPRAPYWMVVGGRSLATWGIDATTAQRVLLEHYRIAATEGDWRVYRHAA